MNLNNIESRLTTLIRIKQKYKQKKERVGKRIERVGKRTEIENLDYMNTKPLMILKYQS